jgi:hypothetical protein
MAGKARRIKKRIDIPVERKFGLYHGQLTRIARKLQR